MEAVAKAIDDIKVKATAKGPLREFDVIRMTMRHLLKKDLGLNSYKRMPRQALEPLDKEKRLERAKILLNKLKWKLKVHFCSFSLFVHCH